MNTSENPLVAASAARKQLGNVSDMTFWRWMQKGILPPPTKINGRNFWRQSEINAVAERAQQAAA